MPPKERKVEDIYQKVSQLEHVLLRPDTYVGSIEYTDKTPMWVYDAEEDKIIHREITYVPGLYKIFDEILVNAADNKQRDKRMTFIRITIDKTKNEISVHNNGQGIPVKMHNKEKMFVPELIFGTLLTSSNYNDDERKVTGGRNGYGAKLCNIFSTKFILETQSKEDGKRFKQVWVKNMTKKDGEAEITDAKGEDFTKITFYPELTRFKMDELDDDIIALMSRRAYDVAGSVPGIKVFLNGRQLPCTNFKTYVEQYTKGREHNGEALKVVFDKPHARWDVALTVSDRGFQQVSFVNSIATTKGGCHVDYAVEKITSTLIETIKKKIGKGGLAIKPFQLKNHYWVFVNALIENPSFDSQTKETMTLKAKDFGSSFNLSDKFLKDITKCGIVDSIMSWVRFKQMEQLDKKGAGKKTAKLKGVPKLEDANDAGTKNSHLCTLILTEGDSAKSLAVAGLGVIGRDHYGVFPLRGKMLNVREATHTQISKNAEVNALLKIVGLQYKKAYTTPEDMKLLRYGKIMIMTDQDQDGSHIKGLVINFIHHNWPHLLRNNFLEEFITPIVKATKGNDSNSFYSLPEYMEWRQNTDNWKTYKIKYYKGLGTSSAKEAKEYFTDMARHRITFDYGGQGDDDAVDLAFSKKKIEGRKAWLTQWMNVRKERRDRGEFEDYLYERDTRSITFAEFVNKELILFSNTDNERSIPSLIDGLKPGQRKVMFTCFKRADKREVKVAQLAGAVGEMSAYHHGEQSLMMTIIGLAHDYVGSNNINLLLPNGQFGTRLQGGKDAASARYIFTQLNPVTKTLFPAHDENVLRFLFEENQRIEPEWYCPIIPMVLVNGAEGIGTGWSTKVPNFNPREIAKNIRCLIRGEEQTPLIPWYRKFNGTILKLDDTRFVCSGEVAKIDNETIEITELPVKVWTQDYKEKTLEKLVDDGKITDFKEYHTEETVKFVIKMKPEQLAQYESDGLHKVFKLQAAVNTTSMVLFDSIGCLRKFNNAEEICREFFDVRKRIYIDRKAFLEGMLTAQSNRLSEQARFIVLKIENKIEIENKKKKFIIEQLVKHKFKPDPVKAWKDLQKKKEMEMRGEAVLEEELEDDEEEPDEQQANTDKRASDYDYLVGMAIWKLSEEDKDKLLAESKAKHEELVILQGKSWSDLWEEDLEIFDKALTEKEKKDKEDLEICLQNAGSKSTTAKGAKKGARKAATTSKRVSKGMMDSLPSKDGTRVVPTLDEMKRKYKITTGAVPKKRKAVDDDDESSPSVKEKKSKTVAKPKEESDDESDAELEMIKKVTGAAAKPTTKIASKTVTKTTKVAAKPAVKSKAKIVESDNETVESVEMSDGSGMRDFSDESDELEPEPTALRKSTRTTKAAKIVYSDDGSEDDESDSAMFD